MTSKSFQRPPTARTASIDKESWPVARDTTPTRLAVVNIRLSQPTAAEKKFSAYFKWSASLQRYLPHVTCSKAQRSIAISGSRSNPVSDSEVTDDGGGVAVADLSREESKRLRAELAEGLGFYPASVAAEDVARYREHIAERKAREEAGERDGWGPGGYKWRKWDHLREERRRTEIETQGRASVADLYE